MLQRVGFILLEFCFQRSVLPAPRSSASDPNHASPRQVFSFEVEGRERTGGGSDTGQPRVRYGHYRQISICLLLHHHSTKQSSSWVMFHVNEGNP